MDRDRALIVLMDLHFHATTWEPSARLMGNLSAGDIADAIENLLGDIDPDYLLRVYHAQGALGDDRPSTAWQGAETASEDARAL